MTPDAGAVTAVLAAVRRERPLVHCQTNVVVAGFSANVLLAAGASPAMVEDAAESPAFAASADALLVNLGTLSRERTEAMWTAAAAARLHGTPWVLDPVAVGALPGRTALAADLLAERPSVVRGNASEVMALAGTGGGGRGVDSTAGAEDARGAAARIVGRTGGAVAVSGAVDQVTDGRRTVEVATGDPLLTLVTGTGCALGALVAAALGAGAGPMDAAVGATVWLTVAAEVAAARSRGPGSFAVELLDALHAVDEDTVAGRLERR